MTLRSPRAALEPERVNSPRRSRGARNPIVIVGNAIFTLVLLLAVVVGVGVYWGKQKFEEPGPLQEDKVLNIPRGLGARDIAELLAREGASVQDIVRIELHIADSRLSQESLACSNRIFADGAAPEIRLNVAALAMPAMLIEVAVTAALANSNARGALK